MCFEQACEGDSCSWAHCGHLLQGRQLRFSPGPDLADEDISGRPRGISGDFSLESNGKKSFGKSNFSAGSLVRKLEELDGSPYCLGEGIPWSQLKFASTFSDNSRRLGGSCECPVHPTYRSDEKGARVSVQNTWGSGGYR